MSVWKRLLRRVEELVATHDMIKFLNAAVQTVRESDAERRKSQSSEWGTARPESICDGGAEERRGVGGPSTSSVEGATEGIGTIVASVSVLLHSHRVHRRKTDRHSSYQVVGEEGKHGASIGCDLQVMTASVTNAPRSRFTASMRRLFIRGRAFRWGNDGSVQTFPQRSREGRPPHVRRQFRVSRGELFCEDTLSRERRGPSTKTECWATWTSSETTR